MPPNAPPIQLVSVPLSAKLSLLDASSPVLGQRLESSLGQPQPARGLKARGLARATRRGCTHAPSWKSVVALRWHGLGPEAQGRRTAAGRTGRGVALAAAW